MIEYRFSLFHKDVGNWTRVTDPIGWDGLGRTMKRYGINSSVGQKWHGIFFEYTANVGFIKDGARFIQTYYEQYGIEQDILLRIETRNPSTRKFEDEFIGLLDLSSYERTSTQVNVTIENIGPLQKIKNALDVKVQMKNLSTTIFHSKILRLEFDRGLDLAASANTPAAPGTYYQIFALTYPNIDEIDTRVEYYNSQISDIEPVGALKYMFKIREGGTYKFTFDINLKREGVVASGSTAMYFVYGRPGTYTTQLVDDSEVWSGLVQLLSFDGIINNVSLNVGDEVYFFARHVQSGSDSNTIYEDFYNDPITLRSVINVIGDTSVPESEVDYILAKDAFSQVVESISGGKVQFASYYLTFGPGRLKAITNGFLIRGIEKPLYCSLGDLVDTFAGIDGLGFGFEVVNGATTLRAEPIDYWFTDKRLMRLPFIKDIKKEVISDLIFNQIEGGPTKWANEKINNLDEFNARREWTNPISKVKNLLDLKIPYITSGYSVEFTRRERDRRTKDTRYDHDNFVIQMFQPEEGPIVPAKDEAFENVGGILSPETSYNLELSPKRCLLRNGRLISSGLHKQGDQAIAFSFGEANTGMFSALIGEEGFFENSEISVSDLVKPVFLPEAYRIRARLTTEQKQLLKITDPSANPNVFGFIEFSKTDQNFKRGYILEAKPKSDSNEIELVLIRAAT